MNYYVKIPIYNKLKILILNVLIVKKSDQPEDIVFYIYDIDNMKYLYICRDCKTSWKTE